MKIRRSSGPASGRPQMFVATDHSCTECTQPYKATPDVIDPNAAGATEPENSERDFSESNMDVDNNTHETQHTVNNNTLNHSESSEFKPVNMVVVDGIVMGPKVSLIL